MGLGSIILGLIICLVVGWFASTLNRSFLGWFLASLFLSPLLTSIVLMILGRSETTHKTIL